MLKNIKKIACALIFTVALASVNAIPSLAYDFPATVRVGLETQSKEKDSLAIGNTSVTVGYPLGSSFCPAGIIAGHSGLTAVPSSAYYIKINASYYNFAEAKMAADVYTASGFNAAAALIAADNWGVYLCGYSSEQSAIAASAAIGSAQVLAPSSSRIALMNGQATALVSENTSVNLQICDANGGFTFLGNRKYRGVIELARFEGKKISAVNVVGLNEYLYSVVPSEMPQSWHEEALKAQAIAARTYTLTRTGVHSASGYGLCDTTHCQAYLGAGNESDRSTAAVNTTTGVAIYYNNQPINAVFFSSSGGVTEDSENAWSEMLPYLRSVKELNETGGKVWTRTFTLRELDAVLKANNVSIGNATGVKIGSVSSTGRVQELTILGTNGSKTITKEAIRTFFSSSVGGSLESRNFTMVNGTSTTNPTPSTSSQSVTVSNGQAQLAMPANSLFGKSASGAVSQLTQSAVSVISASGAITYQSDAATSAANTVTISNSNTITFTGVGFGHGVGMSQYGAKGMADIGYTYEQILKWYYTGVEVR